MGDLVPYKVFQEKQRVKRYGDPVKRLKAMNFDEDFNPFEDEADEYHRLCYGEIEEDEDYWLGETDLTRVIK